jgi:CHAD domain-containing protein
MAKAREIPGLDAAIAFREAAARAVETRAGEVFEHSEGVLDTADIERVHDMRVATRRLRAALEVFQACFPKKEYKRALNDVKALADTLGQRRDPDVHVDELERIAAALTREDARGIRSLGAELRSQQQGANTALAAKLREIEETGLRERLLALAAAARTDPAAA